MTATHGPAPLPDKTGKQAQQDFSDEIRALNHVHTITEWTIDVTNGSLMAMCSCTGLVYSAEGNHHWKQHVRHVRGLDKLPKR